LEQLATESYLKQLATKANAATGNRCYLQQWNVIGQNPNTLSIRMANVQYGQICTQHVVYATRRDPQHAKRTLKQWAKKMWR
jgi:hypothetical protein